MGSLSHSQSGKQCTPWTKAIPIYGTNISMYFIDGTPELAGNMCRNPDNNQDGPWCYVDGGDDVELCDIPRCCQFNAIGTLQGTLICNVGIIRVVMSWHTKCRKKWEFI